MAETALRPEIRLSWERAAATGLTPQHCPDAERAAEVDPGSRLLTAARPVLDALAADLDGSRYTVILADSAQRLIDLRYGRATLRPALENVGAVEGFTFDESSTGTNSIATAFELRRGIAVYGGEHYLETFKRFACYGVPIVDPVTRRTTGVLDLTCPAEDANELLKPLLVRGQREIESRLLGLARRSHRLLLDAFERASGRTTDPVIAFGDDLTLSNAAADERLRPVDHATLRTLLDLAGRVSSIEVELAAGPALAQATRVDGGIVLRVARATRRVPAPATRPPARFGDDWLGPLDRDLRDCRSNATSVLITGPPGAGRTSAARIAAGPSATMLGAAGADVAAVDAAITAAAETSRLIVEELHLLAPAVAARLAGGLAGTGTQVVGTALADADLTVGHLAAVAALCPVHIDLPALRQRRERIPALAAQLLARRTSGRAHFGSPALRALSDLAWPGNLRELANVVGEVAARRSAGEVTAADLPPGYRGTDRPRVAGSLWQAERDAVIQALRTCSGNKVLAAQRLGISRTTLYRRLRTLRIDPDAMPD